MSKKIMDNLDRIVAGVLIVVCLSLVGARHLFGWENTLSLPTVIEDFNRIKDRIERNSVPPPPKPAYAEEFVRRTGLRDRNLPAQLVSWVFYPIPPFETKLPPPPKTVIDAEAINVAMDKAVKVKVARAAVRVYPLPLKEPVKDGVNMEGLIASQQYQVWRKTKAEADWPQAPLAVFSPGPGGAGLPAGVSAAPNGGFEILQQGLKARETYQFRARNVLSFLPQIEQKTVNPPASVTNLGNGLYATAMSETVEVKMPADFQIQLVGSSELPDDKDPNASKKFARIMIRHYRPDAEDAKDGWITTPRDFAVGDNIVFGVANPKWKVRIRDGAKITVIDLSVDSGARLVWIGEKPVKSRIGPDLIPVLHMKIQDRTTKEEFELPRSNTGSGGEWWPRIVESWDAPPPPPVKSEPVPPAGGGQVPGGGAQP